MTILDTNNKATSLRVDASGRLMVIPSGGGSTAANLAIGTRTATSLPITNSNGTGVDLPIATTTLAGTLSAADKTKLDSAVQPAALAAYLPLTAGAGVPVTGTLHASVGAAAVISSFNSTAASGSYSQWSDNSTVYGYVGTGPALTPTATVGDLVIRAGATAKNLLFCNGPTEGMRLTAAGNVGMKTTSPDCDLQVLGAATLSAGSRNLKTHVGGASGWGAGASEELAIGFSGIRSIFAGGDNWDLGFTAGTSATFAAGTQPVQLRLTAAGHLGHSVIPSAWAGTHLAFQMPGGTLWSAKDNSAVYLSQNLFYDGATYRMISGAAGSSYVQVNGDHLWQSAPAVGAGAAASVAEKMRLNFAGELKLGHASSAFDNTPGLVMSPSGQYIAESSGPQAQINRFGSDGAAINFFRQASGVGSISVTTTGTAYNTTSDYRLKANPKPVQGSGAFIDAMKPKTWTWTANGEAGVGFIAHEFQAVSPSSVTGAKDAVDDEGKPVYQSIESSSPEVIANIIAELQSLRARVAELEAQ